MEEKSEAEYEHFWTSPLHRAFVASLNVDRVSALRDLLVLAALADDLFSVQERVEIACALHDLPGLEETIEFDRAEAIDYVDDLYREWEEKGDLLLETISIRLGDELNLRHAFESVIALMATEDKADKERRFARRLGVLMELDDDVVDELLDEYGWDVS